MKLYFWNHPLNYGTFLKQGFILSSCFLGAFAIWPAVKGPKIDVFFVLLLAVKTLSAPIVFEKDHGVLGDGDGVLGDGDE
jgi:hypothetical protein